jgi:hypothetical protein
MPTIRGRIELNGMGLPLVEVRLMAVNGRAPVRSRPVGAIASGDLTTLAVGAPREVARTYAGVDGRFHFDNPTFQAGENLFTYHVYLESEHTVKVSYNDGSAAWSIPCQYFPIETRNAVAELPHVSPRVQRPRGGPGPVAARKAAWVYLHAVGVSRFYENLRARHSTFPAAGKVNFRIPDPTVVDSGYYTDSDRTIWLTEGLYNSPSVIGHEYGHHIMKIAHGGHSWPGGSHTFTAASVTIPPSPTDAQLAALSQQQLAMDFSEGYASFFGQSWLHYHRYRDQDYGLEYNIESGENPSCPREWRSCAGFGDWPTAVFLWDLADPDAPTRESWDRIHKGFGELHEKFIAWGRTLDVDEPRTLPHFYRYLRREYASDAAFLSGSEEIARRSHLAQFLVVPAQTAP